jgi:hypothetical protein
MGNPIAVPAEGTLDSPEVFDIRGKLIVASFAIGTLGPILCWLSALLGYTTDVFPLDFAVELRRPRFDVDVFQAQVRYVPVEQRLELVTAIGSNRSYPKRELVHHVVDEVDSVGLGVAAVDLECANSCGVVDGRVLITSHRRALLPLQCQELHVYLHVVAGNLLLYPSTGRRSIVQPQSIGRSC